MRRAHQYDSLMNPQTAARADSRLHKIQQAVKWTVYTLLIINFVFYILEDWNRATHILDAGSSFLKWTSEFANSIDESAWFLLLFMFELETYVFEDKDLKGWIAQAVHAVRLVCFVMIAHTIYAYTDTVIDYLPTVPVENVSALCDMTNDNVSYVYNLEYTTIENETCGELSTASQFYWVADDPIVTSMEGLELERDLAWADLIEAVVWLLILLAIEIIVRLQGQGVTGGTLIATLNKMKFLLYASLIAIGVYWATLSHWLYLWDELVWIGGFAAIEMNISDWRDEILDEQQQITTAGAEI